MTSLIREESAGICETAATYLEAMGIQAWQSKRAAASARAQPGPRRRRACAHAQSPQPEAIERAACIDARAWTGEHCRPACQRCRLCELHESRTQTVFGVGDRTCRLADHRRSARQGRGPAGRAVRGSCRPVAERHVAGHRVCNASRSTSPISSNAGRPTTAIPAPEEVACCEPYLARQIALIQPRVILAVGRIAAQNLLKTETADRQTARQRAPLCRDRHPGRRHLSPCLPVALAAGQTQGLAGSATGYGDRGG